MYNEIKNFKEFKKMFKRHKVYSYSKHGLKALYNYCKDYEAKTKVKMHVTPKSFLNEWREIHVELALIIQGVKTLSELESETIVLFIPGSDRIVYYRY